MSISSAPLTNSGVDSLFAQLPILSCVDRFTWITEKCRDKQVLDLGCVDETAFEAKKQGSRWLHREIKARAKRVVGLDISVHIPRWKEEYPEDMACVVMGNMSDAADIVREAGIDPEVIVGGKSSNT